jgi:hypothetical protein
MFRLWERQASSGSTRNKQIFQGLENGKTPGDPEFSIIKRKGMLFRLSCPP